jgi:hypothetical protein
MEHIMDTSQFVNKGKFFNFLEKFHIYSATVRSNQNNEESTTESNKIYDVFRYMHCHSHIQSQWQSSHSHTPTRRRQTSVRPTLQVRYPNVPKYNETSTAYSLRIFLYCYFAWYRNFIMVHNFQTEIQRRKHAAPIIVIKNVQELNCEISLKRTRA